MMMMMVMMVLIMRRVEATAGFNRLMRKGVELGTFMYSEVDNKYRQRIIRSGVTELRAWYGEFNHRNKDVEESRKWAIEQQQGAFFVHLRKILAIWSSEAIPMTPL